MHAIPIVFLNQAYMEGSSDSKISVYIDKIFAIYTNSSFMIRAVLATS